MENIGDCLLLLPSRCILNKETPQCPNLGACTGSIQFVVDYTKQGYLLIIRCKFCRQLIGGRIVRGNWCWTGILVWSTICSIACTKIDFAIKYLHIPNISRIV